MDQFFSTFLASLNPIPYFANVVESNSTKIEKKE